MTNETEKKNNAHRLAYSLYCICEDANRINRLSQILNYEPSQLKTDLKDLHDYLSELERKDAE